VAAKESRVAGRELVVVERGGMDGTAAQHSVRVHCSGSMCHITRCICDDYDVGFVIYLLYRVRVYTAKKLSHITYHGFPERASPEHVANLVLLCLVC